MGSHRLSSFTRHLSKREELLFQNCDEVLHYMWDPCSVAGVPEARDEYDGYLPQIYTLVRDAEDGDRIVDHLVSIEVSRMAGVRNSRVSAEEVVEALLSWRRWIWDNVDEPEGFAT